MARPLKTGLDYFSMDVDDDEKIELLEAEHGLEGYALLVKLWKRIYKNGYYINWNNDSKMLFARRSNVGVNLINSVVNVCLLRSLFNKCLYDKYEILTSKGVQERYFKICKDAKRKNVSAIKEYLLVNPAKIGLTLELTQLTPEETLINSDESTQRIEDDSKVNNIIKDDDSSSEIFKFYGNNFGLITQFEMESICSFLDDGVEARLIIRALEIAIEQKAKNWGYAKKILMNKLEQGIKTLAQFEAFERERESKKAPYSRDQENGQNVKQLDNFKQRETDVYDDLNLYDNVKG